MEPELIKTLADLGALGMASVAIVIMVLVIYRTRPSQEVQLQLITLMTGQGKTDQANVKAIQEVASNLRETVMLLQNRTVLFQDFFKAVHKEHATHTEKQGETLTVLTTGFEAANRVIDRMAGVMELAPNQQQLADLLAELKEIKQTVNEIKQGIDIYGGRIGAVEVKLATSETVIEALVKKTATGETPAVASPSKTQAKRNTETTPVIKPDDKPTDVVPRGN